MNPYFKLVFLLTNEEHFELKIDNAFNYNESDENNKKIKNAAHNIIESNAIKLASENLSLKSLESVTYHRDNIISYYPES
jgi:hypothetical protein